MRARWWAVVVTGVVLAVGWFLIADPLADEGPDSAAPDGGPGSDPDDSASPEPSPEPELQVTERRISDPDIDELSGLAASRLHPGVLYGINDSGGSAVVYAIDAEGETVARLRLSGATARDWEALAPGWDAEGRPTLWIGDIGDNIDNQQRVRLYRISEPEQLIDQDVGYAEYWITYADGPNDAEALLVHPTTGELSVVTKVDGRPGTVYRATQPLRSEGTNVLDPVLEAPSGITDGGWELSPNGEPRLVLTDYWRLHRLNGDTWESRLAPLQIQREALAWPWLGTTADNDLVYLGSEGRRSSIITGEVP